MTRWSLAWVWVGLGSTLFVATPALAAAPKSMSEKIGERVSRGAIEESLETLDKAENRARLGRILNSPQMRAALHDLTVSIVTGVFDGVKASATFDTAGVGKSIKDGIDKQVGPAMGRMTYRVVDSALSAALSDEHIAEIGQLGEAATHGVIRGVAKGLQEDLGPALAATIEKDIGPAVSNMLARDVLPGIGRGLDSPEMQSAIANISRTIATEFVGGAGDAMDTATQQDEAQGKESGLKVFGNKVALGYTIALFLAFALATMIIVLTVVLVRSSRRQRKQAAEAKRRETALLRLVDSLEGDHPELKTDVRRLLEEQLHTEP
jgi:hypothetical protein